MKFTFKTEYRTPWGESIGVTIETDHDRTLILHTADGVHWEGETDIETAVGEPVVYHYVVLRDNACVRREVKKVSHIILPCMPNAKNYTVYDPWRDLPYRFYLYSSAFSGVGECRKEYRNILARRGLTVRATCPCLKRKHQKLGICGESEALRNWDEQNPLIMDEISPNVWSITLDADRVILPLQYKFVACNRETGAVEEWESGSNRVLEGASAQVGENILYPEFDVIFDSMKGKVAGTAIPVFSLKSESSFGVGDFGDLKKLVDWAVLTHQKALQILPINDTTITNTWTDSYPYNSISIYAFHPMYMDLSQLGRLEDRGMMEEYEKERVELNALPRVDYEAVNKLKRSYMKAMYQQQGKVELVSPRFKAFFHDNSHWLMPYAAFSYLRDQYGTPVFREWPEYSVYQQDEIEKLCAEGSAHYDEIAFYYYVQYHLHLQLLAASNYAREHGVIFKGDIPIGISRNSVEAWVEPYYFNMNGQAGAPPDAFSVNGQNWGFPTYNWEVMEKDDYLWWKRRFCKMAEYFTAYRIDHILGFFRIWEIPMHSVHGLLGQFVPALPMSVGEIESYGLHFDEDFMTRPFINDSILFHVFGEKADEVKRTFLQYRGGDRYDMLPEFDTQRKVEAWFSKYADGKDNQMKEGLYSLISNVLFVPDRKKSGMYHPRIAVQNDYIYGYLSQESKNAFNALYNQYYYQRHNQFWFEEAMKKLPVLTQSTSMLVCGEDLGMVPDCVPWVMEQLQILSLEIERMPKNPAYEFGHVWEYPFNSVCTISTHDMSTFRGWWEEDPTLAGRYYNEMTGRHGEAPQHADAGLCEDVVRRHLASPSLLCILSFQDWIGIDPILRYPEADFERINVPANPRHYWRYRMHLTLEKLMECDEFNNKLRQLIDMSGR